MKIVITKRTDDWLASIEGNSGYWDCGYTPAMAIGNLILTHPEMFSIEIGKFCQCIGPSHKHGCLEWVMPL